jgi:MGT family glycosyltransferase
MSTKRFLFVVPPFAGHALPTISVARMLERRGHHVAWATYEKSVGSLLPEGAEVFALDDDGSDHAARWLASRARTMRGLESLQFLWNEMLLPLARGMLPQVIDVMRAYEPDVVVADHQAIAGALASRRLDVPFATFCTTSASIVDPLSDLPKVKEWIDRELAALERDAGLPRSASPDTSPHLVVVFSTEDLVGGDRAWPDHYRFVGPSIQDRPDRTPFPWDKLSAEPRVFVSLGTISADAGARFYETTVEALGDRDLQVILAARPSLVPTPPANFIVQERVPQLELLSRVDAVVCHAGHNTVCEALAHGLPLVVAPIRDDQPVVADQVVRAGAGLRVRYGRLSFASLRDAVTSVLAEPRFRQAAAAIRDSFQAAGGATAAAEALLALP